ncbi:putative EPIDERMAL PATTERNING FACTOR-like protein [Helianthus annuus]|uniref:Epidermal patterning factor-like protein n=1 Tax=Helianthus annuus TaxID=4232 RepID=A0A251UFU6_HELAN|nr:putative EPIDERMAL PATTERNING FACTOR-like protein [Helianthus annuus]KAJ0528031.1 putative EPIDERMAL PATTERNING FACTOR-like protein [Helianthus annuus]KAJ0544465.1 putative EPIDERMAL PATTERNING FACTOR-like protein [Helianthus annuus]KAJ0709468.1 putative EPIDERMAL PATTERNING FACTOR-like protein [Helianthus annuus]KAJ0713342.1 putative EPIDERMAL PATTERNING FACTOR-like protein [Helianthus annuus]
MALELKAVITAILLLFFTVASHSISGFDDKWVASVRQNKKILGSRPPRCVHKCVNCRPCEATLVIPPHYKTIRYRDQSHYEDHYYLLSWKCKCGDKLFQP